MTRTRRDNVHARRTRGPQAYDKRKKRAKKRKAYTGPWDVTFSCGATEIQPMARSNEVKRVAIMTHECSRKDCKPIKFERLL